MGQTIDSKYTFELNDQIITKNWYKERTHRMTLHDTVFRAGTNIGWCTLGTLVYTSVGWLVYTGVHWYTGTLVHWWYTGTLVYTSVGSWCTVK